MINSLQFLSLPNKQQPESPGMLPQGDEHQCPLETLFQRCNSSPEGLTTAQAQERLKQQGPNVLRVKKDLPELVKFLLQFKNFFALLLIVGGSLALLAERLDPGHGNGYIAIALFGVVVLNALFTYWQEHQSQRIMESFQNMLPQQVTLLRDAEPVRLPAELVVPGDIILLNEGDKISADGRLIEQSQLKIDLSSLTGESEPQLHHLECTHGPLLESRNMVFSGTLVQSGTGKALVYATGMATKIGNIVQLTATTDPIESPIRRELRHFIKIISSIAILLGVVFFAVSVAMGKGQIASLIFAIGIIVANVPEGLLPTVTLALTMASKRMAKRNALIKNLESVETLGSTTVICTDKTGTLTQNKIRVSTIVLSHQEYKADDQQVVADPNFLSAWQVLTLCNNASIKNTSSNHKGNPADQNKEFTGDPTEGALLLYADSMRSISDGPNAIRQKEYPFDSASKRMITVNRISQQEPLLATLKGAPEVVLEKCTSYQHNGESLPLDEQQRQLIVEQQQRLAKKGERVLALAIRHVDTAQIEESDFTYVGLVAMVDPPRPEVFDAIKRCRQAGIRIIMITGDYGLTAETIGRQIGLFNDGGCIIHGDQLTNTDDQGLQQLLVAPEIIFARTDPLQKLNIVKALQAQGEIVTVTGDGVNDAPALKNADMGVAMGIIGTDVAKEASDMILMDDNFATIVTAIEEGRTIFDNIKKFIAYILTSNIPEILPFLAFALLAIPLPLTVVLILMIDLGTDILPALGLGAERAESDVMGKPPRARHERLLTRNLLLMSYGVIGMIQAAAGFFSYFVVLFYGGWQWGETLATDSLLYRTAVTAFFASIVICQIADVMICRTRRQSIFSVGLLSNQLILLGIATELLLLAAIAYLPWMNILLGTAPLAGWQLCLSLPFALLIVVGDELRRALVRKDNEFVLRWLTW